MTWEARHPAGSQFQASRTITFYSAVLFARIPAAITG
jgi:hypothetical protein